MAKENHTKVTEFVLQGLVDSQVMKPLCFAVVFLIYLISLTGNLGMILLIRMDPQLQKPMYFFLSHLSFLDLGYSSAVAPKMLGDFLAQKTTISYIGCTIQMYFFVLFTSTECIILTAMAYDRYAAICHPLMYMVKMSPKICGLMVAGSYLVGIVNAMIQTISIFSLSFCGSNVINHFFCDVPPLLILSCTDTTLNEIILFIFAIIQSICTVVAIVVSYMFILSAILKIRSAEGKQQAFSTCASHLMVVAIFYGTTGFMYLKPKASYSMNQDKWASVFYTVVVPMLNPLVYSLRNKDVKHALRRISKRNILF